MVSLRDLSSSFHFRRKVFHICFGIFWAAILNLRIPFISENLAMLMLLLIAFGMAVSFASRKRRLPLVSRMLELFDKKEDIGSYPGKGAIYFTVGVLVSVIAFPRDVASASIMVLTFGDSVSHIIGRYYGKTRMIISRTKLLEGTIAGIAAATVAASFFVRPPEAFFGSLIAMIVEAIELEFFRLDDNLSVPIAAGAAISLLRFLA